jgi:hypothetical protein
MGAGGGNSKLRVNNSQGVETEVRLYAYGESAPVRRMLVSAGDVFTTANLAQGLYVIRWRRLGGHTVYRADEDVLLFEQKTDRGVRPQTVEINLSKGARGSRYPLQVPESEF